MYLRLQATQKDLPQISVIFPETQLLIKFRRADYWKNDDRSASSHGL